MTQNWSDQLVELTRDRIGLMLQVGPEARQALCVKHWEDRFGILTVKPDGSGLSVVARNEVGKEDTFRSVDEFLDAGWVLD